jgi:hypothetical protein
VDRIGSAARCCSGSTTRSRWRTSREKDRPAYTPEAALPPRGRGTAQDPSVLPVEGELHAIVGLPDARSPKGKGTDTNLDNFTGTMARSQSTPILVALGSFLRDRWNLKPNTVRTYRNAIRRFAREYPTLADLPSRVRSAHSFRSPREHAHRSGSSFGRIRPRELASYGPGRSRSINAQLATACRRPPWALRAHSSHLGGRERS